MCKMLKEYLYNKKMNASQFAKKANIAITTTHKVLAENYVCGKMVAEKIELATDGKIPAGYLLDKTNQGYGDFSKKIEESTEVEEVAAEEVAPKAKKPVQEPVVSAEEVEATKSQPRVTNISYDTNLGTLLITIRENHFANYD